MENKYFKERQEKYDEISKENEQDIVNQKISLRKNKKNEILMSKRAKVLSGKIGSEFKPKIEREKLSQKALSLFE